MQGLLSIPCLFPPALGLHNMSDDKFIPGSSLFKGSIQEASSNKVWHENFQVNEGVTECFFQREITIFEALAPRKSSTKAKQCTERSRRIGHGPPAVLLVHVVDA